MSRYNSKIYWTWAVIALLCQVLAGVIAWLASPQGLGIWQLGIIAALLIPLSVVIMWHGSIKARIKGDKESHL